MKKARICALALCLLVLVLLPVTAAAAVNLPDGVYTAEVSLTGGSGKATVTSPAEITVENGHMTATVVWSSKNYDYMEVDGQRYLPVQTEGNSTFVIPVTMDVDIPVSAETLAMSQPHVIEYTLHFDGGTVRSAGDMASPSPLVWAVVVIAAAAVIVIRVLRLRKARRNGEAA